MTRGLYSQLPIYWLSISYPALANLPAWARGGLPVLLLLILRLIHWVGIEPMTLRDETSSPYHYSNEKKKLKQHLLYHMKNKGL
jgi:hypothetical protein